MPHPTEDKSFRLSPGIRPSSYVATVTVDLAARTFSGDMVIAIRLDAPAREIVLHALELELAEVVLTSQGSRRAPTSVRLVPQSGTAVLDFQAPVPAGEAELFVRWRGKLNDGMRGLYWAGGMAASQFEAADARRMFPCFDEPAFKATWSLTARVPKEMAVLSNGEVVRDEADGAWRKVTFAKTELLSSYLIALVCGPLVAAQEGRVNDVRVQTWATEDKRHLAQFGQEMALAALPKLQDYFGLPYAFGKIDQVGLPEFEAGAMENAGLITFRETALLLDPATAPLAVKKRVAEVVTHELAHQWFGNWVTMAWWDDLWLNEAFATWMAYKVVDGLHPKWRVWLDFDQGKSSALHLDALRSTHPVRGVVHNADEATESFDLITYEKGGAVLRMIEGFLGEGPFREGIRDYMKKHARGNAVADDLWGALAKASSQPVVTLANAWIRQSGYPVVTASLREKQLTLSQSRFYSEPGVQSGEVWPVPVVLRYADGQGVREKRVLLESERQTVELEAEPHWLCANGGSTGFYRVHYEDSLMSKAGEHLASLASAERIQLVNDLWALVRAGRADLQSFLTLLPCFEHEKDDAVLDELVGRLSYLEGRLLDEGERPRFWRFVERLLGAQFDQLGWDADPAETDGERLRRASIFKAVGGVARSRPILDEARRRLRKVLDGQLQAIEPNLMETAVAVVAREGDAGLFDELLARFPQEKDPAVKRRYLLALTAFESPQLTRRAQELLFARKVPMQDSSFFITGLLGNRMGRDAFWDTLRERWNEVLDVTGHAPMLMRRVVEAFGQLRERRQLDEAKAFLKSHPVEAAAQATAQTLERLDQDVAFRERTHPAVSTWLSRSP
jgi:puromycin-sensitive aminopeptidase